MTLLHRIRQYAGRLFKSGRDRLLSLLRGALAVALAIAVAPPAGQAADEVVARIGKIELTAGEVRGYVETLDPREQAAVNSDLGLLSQVVRTLLSREAVLAEAEREKWAEQPEVKAQLERVRDSAIVESYLQSVSAPPEDFPSEADLQAAYDASKTAFLVPRQFRLAQIYVAAPSGGGKEELAKAQQKLDAVLKKLRRKGADFAAIAEADSDAKETAARGGEIGWLLETQIRPEIRDAAAGLAKGAVSEPLRLDEGWHIVKLLDTKAAYTRPLEEVREPLVARLRAERAVALRQAYLASLLQEQRAAINELALSKLVTQPEQAARK